MKRWWWVALLLVLLLAGGTYGSFRWLAARNGKSSAAAQETAQVYRGDIVLSVTGKGNLVPRAQVALGFRTSGVLASLEVKVGDRVGKGQVLARLDTQELELQLAQAQLQLEQAEASLRELLAGAGATEILTARKNLEQAQANLEDTRVSTAVSVQQAQLNLLQAANAVRDAQAAYENIYWQNRQIEARTGELPDANADAEAEAWRKVENAQAAMEAARLSYESALERQGTSIRTAEAQVAVAQANLQDLLKGADQTQIASAQATVEQARLNVAQAQLALEKAVLTAPFTGTVIAIDTVVGEQVSGSILTLADLDAPLVQFWVEETDLAQVAVGHRVRITFEALPDLTFDGQVIQVDPALVTVDGTPALQAWASIDLDPNSVRLFSGMSAEVEVIAAEAHDALLVPLQALRELAPGKYGVFVVRADGTLELRQVEVGLQDDVQVQILSGVELGENVLLESSSAAASSQSNVVFPGAPMMFPGEMPPQGGRP
ncbi:MAG: efflux RND transporter periplasmic adaptor subunit [Chloroflexia bacterium]